MAQPAFLYKTYPSVVSVVASSTLSGFDAEDILIATEDTKHAPDSVVTYNYVFDMGVPYTGDYFAILGANIGSISVEVRGSTDDFSGSDDLISAEATISADVNTAWRSFDTAAYRYWKFIISGHATNVRISNITVSELIVMPYFANDWDDDSLEIESTNLVSSSGVFIGVNQQNSMRNMDLDIGEVTPADLATVLTWVDECIKVSRPFYFVPDIDEDTVYYGWLQSPSFSAPFDGSMHQIQSMRFKTRAV